MKKQQKKQVKKILSKFGKKTSKKLVSKTPKYLELKGFLSFFILHELDRKSMSGDALAKDIGGRKGTTLTSGTIYPALKRLRKQKLIAYTRHGRKKVYSLTSEGKSELKALYHVLGGFFAGVKGKLKR
jgi:DNA-binding MarR family transcriptional regulator